MILGKLTRRLNDYLFPFFSLVMLELLQHTRTFCVQTKKQSLVFCIRREGCFGILFFYFLFFIFFSWGKNILE